MTPVTPSAGETIDLNDEASVQHWLDHFGVTREQVEEAVGAVGADAQAVQRHLLDSGASAGAG